MKNEQKSKRLFVIRDTNSESGGAFVAENAAEAKKMALREDIAEEWIDLRVKTLKNDVTGWEKGIVDYKRCLREGIFDYVQEDCDNCKEDHYLACVTKDGKCVCDDCYELLSKPK